MKGNIMLTLNAVCLFLSANAQLISREFVNKAFIPIDSAGASYVLQIERENVDSENGTVKTYDLSGNLLKSTEYSSLKQKIVHGKVITYYMNSQQARSVLTYDNDKEDGIFVYYFNDGSIQALGQKSAGQLMDTLKTFFANGKIKRLETYLNGELSGGYCYDSTGAVQPHYPLETEAEFPGGNKELMHFIQQNLVYPSEAIELNVSGKVCVQFTIDSLGMVQNIEIEKGVNHAIDKEVIRVVQMMPRWMPGTFDGESISSLFRLPVNFELDGGIGDLICMDSNARLLNQHWISQYVVLADAFSGEPIASFSHGRKSYFRLFLLNTEKGKIKRKKIEFSRLESIRDFKFNSRRHAKRFRQFCL